MSAVWAVMTKIEPLASVAATKPYEIPIRFFDGRTYVYVVAARLLMAIRMCVNRIILLV